MNSILVATIAIISFVTLSGVYGYVINVTGNRLDLSDEEIEKMKMGIKGNGVQVSFRNGIFYTLLLILAVVLTQFTSQITALWLLHSIIGISLGITNVYVSFRRVEILALQAEMSLILQFKMAFVLLGVVNFGIAIISYLIG